MTVIWYTVAALIRAHMMAAMYIRFQGVSKVLPAILARSNTGWPGFNSPDTVIDAHGLISAVPGMRRRDKEITERVVIEEILREQEVGRLATAVDSEPYVVPINFVYSDDKVIFHSHRDGKKMTNIARNPRVCFEVDSGEIVKADKPCDFSWRYMSVIVRGRAKVVEDEERRLAYLRKLSDKYSPGKGRALTMEDVAKNPQLVLVEIYIDEMTGKRSPKSSSA